MTRRTRRKKRKRRRRRRRRYLQQVTADSGEDEAGHDHPARVRERRSVRTENPTSSVRMVGG